MNMLQNTGDMYEAFVVQDEMNKLDVMKKKYLRTVCGVRKIVGE